MKLRASILAAGLGVVMAVSLGGCDNPEQKLARFLKRGNEYFSQEQYVKARVEYKNALQVAPASAEPIYRLARVDEATGDLRNAFTGFMAAEQQDAAFAPATLKVAQYYMVANLLNETQTRLSRVLAADPNNADAHALMAALLMREEKFDDALREVDAALAISPANEVALSTRVGVYLARGDYEKAVSAADDARAHNPRSIDLILMAITAYAHGDHLDKIVAAYDNIFALQPKNVRHRTDLAAVLSDNGRVDQAESVLRAAIKDLPDDDSLKQTLVYFLNDKRGFEAAEAEIQKLLAADPKKSAPSFWLADIYVRRGDTSKAASLLNHLIADSSPSAPPSITARTMLAHIGLSNGDKSTAKRLVSAVLESAPDNRDALLMRAHISYDEGRLSDAVSDARSVLRIKPNDTAALRLLAETLLRQERSDLAIDTMKKVVDAAPEDNAAIVRLAQMVNVAGDPKQALTIVSSVTKLSPHMAIAWESAARFAIAAKEWLPAQAAVKTLASLEGQQQVADFLDAQIKDAAGKQDEAVAIYARLFLADPNAPLADRILDTLFAKGDQPERLNKITALLEPVSGLSPYANNILGRTYIKLGQPEKARVAFDKSIVAEATFDEPYIQRARLYSESGDTDSAIRVLRQGTAAAPGEYRAALAAASLADLADKTELAVEFYEETLRRSPDNVTASNNLAAILADTRPNDAGALDRARKLAERAAGSNNPYLLDTLAWVYFRQGNYPLAQTVIGRAFSQQSDLPPQMYYHYAAILAKAGRTEQARAAIAKALPTDANYRGKDEARKLKDAL